MDLYSYCGQSSAGSLSQYINYCVGAEGVVPALCSASLDKSPHTSSESEEKETTIRKS